MKTLIGLTFLLVSPLFLGSFLLLAIGGVLGIAPADFMPVAFTSYTVIWLLMYVGWFDGSVYQTTL